MVRAKKKSLAHHASRITHHEFVGAVVDQLQSYASRGVFREFAIKKLPGGRVEFRFTWLTPRAIRATFDAKSGILTLIDLLPDISPRSAMDKALRAFIDGRFSPKLPEHRRLSKSSIKKLVCVNKRRSVSIRLTLNKSKAGDATREAIRLVSELFQNFLAGPYHEYMVKNFDLRED